MTDEAFLIESNALVRALESSKQDFLIAILQKPKKCTVKAVFKRACNLTLQSYSPTDFISEIFHENFCSGKSLPTFFTKNMLLRLKNARNTIFAF